MTNLSESRARYLTVCSGVADRMEVHGFRYLRSFPKLRRVRGAWQEDIAFQSSHYSTPDSATVRVMVVLYSRKLAAWRREVGSPLATDKRADWVFSTYIESLTPNPSTGWYVGPDEVDAAVSEITSDLERYALPFYDEAEGQPSRLWYKRGAEAPLLELILLLQGRVTAEAALRWWMGRWPPEAAEVKREVVRYQEEESLPYGDNVSNLARAIVFHDMPAILERVSPAPPLPTGPQGTLVNRSDLVKLLVRLKKRNLAEVAERAPDALLEEIGKVALEHLSSRGGDRDRALARAAKQVLGEGST